MTSIMTWSDMFSSLHGVDRAALGDWTPNGLEMSRPASPKASIAPNSTPGWPSRSKIPGAKRRGLLRVVRRAIENGKGEGTTPDAWHDGARSLLEIYRGQAVNA
jgi:hypothetical protein